MEIQSQMKMRGAYDINSLKSFFVFLNEKQSLVLIHIISRFFNFKILVAPAKYPHSSGYYH